MITVHHFQGFDFLTPYVYLLCILFFSDQIVWNFKLWAEPKSI